MYIIFLFVLLFLNPLSVFGQSNVIQIPLHFTSNDSNWHTTTIPLLAFHESQDIACSFNIQDINSSNANLFFEFDNREVKLKHFHEAIYDSSFVSELIFIKPTSNVLHLKIQSSHKPRSGFMRIFVLDDAIDISITNKLQIQQSITDCTCPKPNSMSRIQWGSRFQLSDSIYKPPATYTPTTHLIVHHSAGSNTNNNWPAIVAAIFDFHVNTNGWQDIGYNYLIDPQGVIYDGRGGGIDVRGAHMCGYNDNTMGVCMIGTYTNQLPTAFAQQALVELLSWKACVSKINPTSIRTIHSYPGVMPTIAGHKDGCAPNYTSCPGNVFHSELHNIAEDVNQYMQLNCNATTIHQNDESEAAMFFDFHNQTLIFNEEYFGIPIQANIIDMHGRTVCHLNSEFYTCDITALNLIPGMYYCISKPQETFFNTPIFITEK